MTGREDPVNPQNFVAVNEYSVDGSTMDLGSGTAHPHAEGPADVTVDADPEAGPDMLYAIEDWVPAPADSFDNVTAVHFLEHLPGDNDVKVWEDMKRVAAKRAIAILPIGKRSDPDHEHEYSRQEAIDRFDHSYYDFSQAPAGIFDIVLVAETDE